MNGSFEIGVYLTHFINVDLFRQGVYFFRISVYAKDECDGASSSVAGPAVLAASASSLTGVTGGSGGPGSASSSSLASGASGRKSCALPYRTMQGSVHEQDFLMRSADRRKHSGHVDSLTSSYCSSSFRVQFQEQRVRLNEGCLFRIDLPYRDQETPLYIDIELVFSELHASDYKKKGIPPLTDFTIVDSTTLVMERIHSGVHALYPTTFSPSHFCLLYVMVHCELVNFKFIPPSFPPKKPRSSSPSAPQFSMVGGKKMLQQHRTVQSTPHRRQVKRAKLRSSPAFRAVSTLGEPSEVALVRRDQSSSATTTASSAKRSVPSSETSSADSSSSPSDRSGCSPSSGLVQVGCFPSKRVDADGKPIRHLSSDIAADLRKESSSSMKRVETESVSAAVAPLSGSSTRSSSMTQSPSEKRSGSSGSGGSDLDTHAVIVTSDPSDAVRSFAEVLFGEDLDRPMTKADWSKALSHHLYYVSAMINTYHRLTNVVTESVEGLLDPSRIFELSELDELYPVPPLELPATIMRMEKEDQSVMKSVLLLRGQSYRHSRTDSTQEDRALALTVHKVVHQSPMEGPAKVDGVGEHANHDDGDDDDGGTPDTVAAVDAVVSGFPSDITDLDWKGLRIYAEKLLTLKHRALRAEKKVQTGRQVCQMIAQDIHEIAAQVFRVWHFFLGLVPHCKRKMSRALRKQWERQFVERWSACIFRETLGIRDRTRVVTTSLSEHALISSTVRKQQTIEQLDPPPLQDMRYVGSQNQAVIFEQTYNQALPHSSVDMLGVSSSPGFTGGADDSSTSSLPILSAISDEQLIKSSKSSSSSRFSALTKKFPRFGKSKKKEGMVSSSEVPVSDLASIEAIDSRTLSRPTRTTVFDDPTGLFERLPTRAEGSSSATTTTMAASRSGSGGTLSRSADATVSKRKGVGLSAKHRRSASDVSAVASDAVLVAQDSLGMTVQEFVDSMVAPEKQSSAMSSSLSEETMVSDKGGGRSVIVRRRPKSLASDSTAAVPSGLTEDHVSTADDTDHSTDVTGTGTTSGSSDSSTSVGMRLLEAPIKAIAELSFSVGEYLTSQDAFVSAASPGSDSDTGHGSVTATTTTTVTDGGSGGVRSRKSVVSSAKDEGMIIKHTSTLQSGLSLSSKKASSSDLGSGAEHACIGKHLFVLVHGYQGNSWDMRMFRNHVMVLCPHDLFLMSQANEKEENNDGDIEEMGRRLAEEIDDFIVENIIAENKELCRLSFVCHSLGGVVAREALSQKRLKPYILKCHTFISLAVCHCGYLFGRSKAIQAGFWVMRSWKKSVCLSQLSLSDSDDPRKSYLYQLSLKPSLEYFRNVLLVSSPEDRYTPYHSTRIEMHRRTVQDTKWGRVYNDMVRNLLRPLDQVNLTRFDVSFLHKKVNLDSMIGRSAHICFLEQPLYIDMLIYVYKRYFASVDTQRRRVAATAAAAVSHHHHHHSSHHHH